MWMMAGSTAYGLRSCGACPESTRDAMFRRQEGRQLSKTKPRANGVCLQHTEALDPCRFLLCFRCWVCSVHTNAGSQNFPFTDTCWVLCWWTVCLFLLPPHVFAQYLGLVCRFCFPPRKPSAFGSAEERGAPGSSHAGTGTCCRPTLVKLQTWGGWSCFWREVSSCISLLGKEGTNHFGSLSVRTHMASPFGSEPEASRGKEPDRSSGPFKGWLGTSQGQSHGWVGGPIWTAEVRGHALQQQNCWPLWADEQVGTRQPGLGGAGKGGRAGDCASEKQAKPATGDAAQPQSSKLATGDTPEAQIFIARARARAILSGWNCAWFS